MTDKEKIKSEFEKRSILCKKAQIDLRKDINIAYYEGKETAYKEAVLYIDSLQEEPVSIWHDASEEPDDMSHCLIYYGCKESVGHYLHYEPVLYNKKEKMFLTSSFPHPTGYKVEQKSFDGGCVAEVYKDRRDRISISDITQWCYLYDLHKLSNVERIGKDWKEEPVSEDLEEASKNHAAERYRTTRDRELAEKCKWSFKAGAEWQKNKMMEDAIKTTIKAGTESLGIFVKGLDSNKYSFGDKVKLIIIKQEEE